MFPVSICVCGTAPKTFFFGNREIEYQRKKRRKILNLKHEQVIQKLLSASPQKEEQGRRNSSCVYDLAHDIL